MRVVHLYETYIKVYGGVFFMLLSEMLKEFIFDCEIRKMSSRTIKSYKNIIQVYH